MKRINLIPLEAKKTAPNKWIKKHLLKSRSSRFIAIAVIIFIVINVWQATSLLRYKLAIASNKKKISQLRSKLGSSQDKYAEIKNERELIEKEIAQIEARFKLLRQIEQERVSWAMVLEYLSKLVPQNLWVDKISLKKDLITIVGTTFDNENVGRFMEGLDESKYFQKTSFNYTKKEKLTDRPVINFEVTTHLVESETWR